MNESDASREPKAGAAVQPDEVAALRADLARAQARADLFQRVLEQLPGIVYVDEPDDTASEVFTSPRIVDLLGWPASADTPDHWLTTVVHPDDRALVESVIKRTNAGERVQVEYRCLTRDGNVRWVNDDAIPEAGPDGAVVAVHGYITDITELKRLEDERRLADERYRTLVDELPAAIYVAPATPDGSSIFISKRIEEMLGYPADTWIGPESGAFFLGTVLHPDDRDRVVSEMRANSTGVATVSEYRCLHRDGRTVWVHDESTPERDANGDVVAVRGFMIDVTDSKAAEDELRRSDERLRAAERMESVGRLAGGVAHDFNNLLTVIQGNVDLMLGLESQNLPIREGLNEVAEAARRASMLTNQLLAYSRQQVLQPHVLDLNQTVEHLGGMLQRLLGAKITLELTLADDLWPVRVDRSQLEQVVVNLTVNARDAMPTGGLISISTENRRLEPPAESGFAAGEYVALSVADTGVGFDEPIRMAMFEPFFTTKPVGKGTGLGLATVDGIVRQSGGWVDVESSPGQGAMFTVVLPRCVGEIDAPDPLPPLPARDRSSSATILVVEDTDAVRELVARTLEAAGYTVVAAATGEAALELLTVTQVRIDLLLTDLVMPGLDGHALATTLEQRRPGLRVVYMSGYTYDEIVRHGIEAAELAFLPKPFVPATLLERVETALAGPPSSDRT
ncbi:MAG: PAS domain-containing protein [Gaiellales bacterium]